MAWLEVKFGIVFRDYKNVKPGVTEFSFDMAGDEWKQKKLEYYESETLKTKYVLKKLKDMIN